MHHPAEGELQAHLDGELGAERAAWVEEHLAGCAECRAEKAPLRDAAEAFRRALLLFDADAAGRRIPDALEILRSPRRSRFGWSALARAAVLILAAVGVAAALVPGVAVREWWKGVLDPGRVVEVVPQPEETSSAAAPGPAALLVPMVQRRVTVELTGFAPSSRVVARLSDAMSARIQVTGTARRPRFVVAPGRVKAVGEGEAEIRVELPRSAETATVSIDGRPALVVSAGHMQLRGAALDTLAEDVRFRVGH